MGRGSPLVISVVYSPCHKNYGRRLHCYLCLLRFGNAFAGLGFGTLYQEVKVFCVPLVCTFSKWRRTQSRGHCGSDSSSTLLLFLLLVECLSG
jgi:hypothetical protein